MAGKTFASIGSVVGVLCLILTFVWTIGSDWAVWQGTPSYEPWNVVRMSILSALSINCLICVTASILGAWRRSIVWLCVSIVLLLWLLMAPSAIV